MILDRRTLIESGEYRRDDRGRFLTGNFGGPGRPKGSRNKVSEEFLAALYADFQQHGAAAIQKVREENTAVYVKVAASMVPKELHISNDGHEFDHLSDEGLREYLIKEVVLAVLSAHLASTRRSGPARRGDPSARGRAPRPRRVDRPRCRR